MPDSYRVKILPEAYTDFEGIVAYIDQDSPQNAVTVAQKLMAGIDSLTESPHRCKVHRASRDPAHVVHAMSIPPFIVYYRVDERRTLVEILAIRHGARRQPTRFE